jgi:hypothetical protein
MRYSTRMLLIVMLVAALGLAGLRYASVFIGSVFTTAVFLVLLVGVLAAWRGRAEMRSFWIGFTLFGACYFLFATFGEGGDPLATAILFGRGPVEGQIGAPKLATTRLLLIVDSYVQSQREDAYVASTLTTARAGVMRGADSTIGFLAIGQAMFTLLFAFLGAQVGSWMDRQRQNSGHLADLASPGENA